jgi:hypothetical protein
MPCSPRTLIQIVLAAGERCERLLSSRLKNVPVDDVQCDEIWGFVQKKQGNRRGDESDFAYVGDSWIFVAVERNSKLVLTYDLGKRTVSAGFPVMGKLAKATDPNERFQLTTDGLKAFNYAVDTELDKPVDLQPTRQYFMPRMMRDPLGVIAPLLRCTAIPIRRGPARPTLSVRTQRCGCACAALRG